MGRYCGLLSSIAAAVLLVAVLVAPCLASGLIDSSWPGFRHDALHTGRSSYPGPADGVVGWSCHVGGTGAASPAVADGRIYVVGDGALTAVSDAGAILWMTPCGNTGKSSPSIASDGTVYTASTDGYLYAFYPDGAVKWRQSLQGSASSSVTIGADGTVYVGSDARKLFAFRSDGSLKFAYPVDGAVASSPAIAPDGTVYFGCNDGRLYALWPTGQLKWAYSTYLGGAVESSPCVGPDGTVYFGTSNGYLQALSSTTGTQKWRKSAGSGIVSSPALGADGSIYVGCRDGHLYCLSPAGGGLKWMKPVGGWADSSPAIDSNGIVYIGSYNGSVYAYRPDGTLAWSTRVGPAVLSSPAIGENGALYVVSNDGVLHAFRSDTTPPPPPIVVDDGDFTSAPDRLHASWDCSDPESGIARYEYCIRDSGGRDIVPFTNAGPLGEVEMTGLQLVSGEVYYFVIRAVNGAGLVGEPGISDGILVDLTAPQAALLEASVAIENVRVRVSATDPESGVVQVQCALLTSPQVPASPDWVGGEPGQEMVLPGPLDPAGVYYVAARALNRAGLWSASAVTGPLRVDDTPPTAPTVTDSGAYAISASTIEASWSAQDPESGIDHYSYCVGSGPGLADVAPWADTTDTSRTITGLNLVNGAKYYVSVKATNRAGLTGVVGTSDGITVDSTSPSRPVVVDDGEYTSSPDCLHVTVASSDAESGIAGYTYCVGTAPGAADVAAWVEAAGPNQITVCGLALQEGVRYYVSARSVNGAGLQSVVGSSDGIEFRIGICAWPRFRSDSRNSGCAAIAASMTGRLHWRVQTQGYIESSAAIGADGTAYVGSSDGRLYAITSVGSVKWSFDTGTCVDSSPAIAPDGCIYVGAYDGLYCVSASGTLKWKHLTGSMVWSSPNIGPDGTVYFGCQNHGFYAVRPDGTLKWKFTAGGSVWSSPAISPDGTIYFACGDGRLYALTASGALKWTYQTGSAADSSPAVGEDGVVYFGSGDGHLYSLSSDGSLRWRAYLGQLVDSSPAVTSDGRVYVGTGGAGYSGAFYAISTDGVQIWRMAVSGGVRSSPAVDENGFVCFGSADGKVYTVSRDGTVLWSYATGDSILASPAIGTGGAVVIGSDDGGIYCFRDVGTLDSTPPTRPEVRVARQFVSPDTPLSASWSSSDPESGIRSYSYAIGTEPGTDDVVSWTDAGVATSISRSNLPLLPGRSYYIAVKAQNHALLTSDTGVSEPVIATAGNAANTIGGAKSRLAGTQVSLPGKVVTAVFPDCVFVEEPDRSSAIRCVTTSVGTPQVGTVVSVAGTIGSRYGEVVLTDPAITQSGFQGHVGPVGLPCETLCKVGLDLSGMLVRVAGRVSKTGSGWFTLTDGSYMLSPRGGLGIEVQGSAAAPAVDSYVAVTGIACRELVCSRVVTVIRSISEPLIAHYPAE